MLEKELFEARMQTVLQKIEGIEDMCHRRLEKAEDGLEGLKERYWKLTATCFFISLVGGGVFQIILTLASRGK